MGFSPATFTACSAIMIQAAATDTTPESKITGICVSIRSEKNCRYMFEVT